jgi:serine/threonine-protein kinase
LQSIAILPFRNLDANQDDQYLADGLAEHLTDVLSRVEGVHIVSRASAARFRDRAADLRQLGKSLNVDTVLDGSLQRAGSRIYVAAELVQTDSGFHLWSRTYDRDLDNVIAVEEDLARQITGTFLSHLASNDEILLSARYSAKPKAYEQYLKGLYAYDRGTKDGLERSLDQYQLALHLDPTYTPALNALAASYGALGIYGFWRPVDAIPKAREAAARALSLDPNLDSAHAILGFCAATYDWDWATANAEFRKAIALNPNCSTCRAWFSFYYLAPKQLPEEAYRQLSKALELDPLEPRFQSFRIAIPVFLREFDRAIEEGHRAINQNSNDYIAHLFLGWALRQTGRYAEALDEDLQTDKLTNSSALALRNLGDLYGAMGQKREAESILERLTAASRHGYVSPVIFALIYSALGDSRETFQWLDRAIEERDLYLIFLRSGPLYERWKTDPRLQTVLRRIGLQ